MKTLQQNKIQSYTVSMRDGKKSLKTFRCDLFDGKVWIFWEGHKIWKNLRPTFDKSIVFCARNSVLVKDSMKIFQNKCGQVSYSQK